MARRCQAEYAKCGNRQNTMKFAGSVAETSQSSWTTKLT